MDQKEIQQILSRYKTIAVVGLSRDPRKESYRVASYMKNQGYRIIPVNPFAEEVLDEKSYANLNEIPLEIQATIDIVNVFRPSKDVPPIVEQTIQLKEANGKPHVIWMQQGIVHEAAAQKARSSGLKVVMDKCVMVEHRRLSF
jgi:predicted CoA-binding protein